MDLHAYTPNDRSFRRTALSSLPNGILGHLKFAAFGLLLMAAAGCASDEGAPTASDGIDRSSPEAAAQTMLTAIVNRDYDVLPSVCDPAGEVLANVAFMCAMTADDPNEGMFYSAWSVAGIDGETTIDGDRAKVPISFDLETGNGTPFDFVERDGSWYLVGF